MLTLYLTRHGETIWNTEQRIQGWRNSDLTEEGIENAISLGKRLSHINFSAIYSSPSGRAFITAELICGSRNIPIIKLNGLKEINLGKWEGQTQTEIKKYDNKEFDAFWITPHVYNPQNNNGESFYDLRTRVVKSLNKIIYENASGNVLIVSHSVAIKTMMAYFNDLPIEKLWDPPIIQDTSLTVIKVGEGSFNITMEGDISHKKSYT